MMEWITNHWIKTMIVGVAFIVIGAVIMTLGDDEEAKLAATYVDPVHEIVCLHKVVQKYDCAPKIRRLDTTDEDLWDNWRTRSSVYEVACPSIVDLCECPRLGSAECWLQLKYRWLEPEREKEEQDGEE